jgi:hypothetical protein
MNGIKVNYDDNARYKLGMLMFIDWAVLVIKIIESSSREVL